MDKYIYDNKNGLWYKLQGDYYIPCLILSAEKKTAYRFVGTAALAVSERTSQKYIHNATYKRQTERLPCRCRLTGARAHGKAHREMGAGYH